ncbi:MAG: VOC family protein [Pseudomonadota bacterium]
MTIAGFVPRLSMVTLGVDDLRRATKFWTGMGFTVGDSTPDIVFFQSGDMVFSLYGRAALAAEMAAETAADTTPQLDGSPQSIGLSINVFEAITVQPVLDLAATLGGRIVKSAEVAFWGGTSGYFADPDGHRVEVAHNPFWVMDAGGRIRLPGS